MNKYIITATIQALTFQEIPPSGVENITMIPMTLIRLYLLPTQYACTIVTYVK